MLLLLKNVIRNCAGKCPSLVGVMCASQSGGKTMYKHQFK